MSERIPKPVRDVLAKQKAAEPHPSPDLLNAYVEQSLATREKNQVAQHLARCEECREVVFLASGAAEEELVMPLVAAAHPNRMPASVPVLAAKATTTEARNAKPRRAGPWWKWAAPVAAVVILAGGAVIERDRVAGRAELSPAIRRAPAPTPDAKATPSTAASPAAQEEAKARAEWRGSIEVESKKEAASSMHAYKQLPSAKAEIAGKDSAGRRDERLMAHIPAAAPGGVVGGLARGNFIAHANPSQPSGAAPQAKAPPPATSSQTVEVTSAAPLVQADNADLSPAVADALKPKSLAKSSLVANNEPQAAPAMLGATASARALAHAQWRITSEGHLERSLDGSAWTQVLASEPVTFRTVVKVGRNNFWAGGDNGALFHSGDGGEHWNKVALNETGKIISIEFTSPQQGSLTTVSGAVWKTSDGGHTWSKQ